MKSGDPILNVMRGKEIPVTRANYLNLNYMGRPPKELHPEEEAEMPEELRGPDDPPGGIHPVNAFLNDNPFLDLEFCKILWVLSERRKEGR